MAGTRAIVVVDVHGDPWEPGRLHRAPRELVETLGWLVRAARQLGDAVVWVAAGEMISPISQLAAPGDVRVAPDGLRAMLEARGGGEVVVAGVATGGAVAALAREARALGLTTSVLADATAAATIHKHDRALRELAEAGVAVRSWVDVIDGRRVELGGLGAGGTQLVCGALEGCLDGGTFEGLAAEVAWSVMRHRGGEVPRLVALQGELGDDGVEPLYRHPADEQPAMQRWTPIVERLRRAVERQVGHPLNHALIQLYRHGKDWIGEHADKTLDLARPSCIVNVSLGARRTMILRPKRAGDDAVQRIPLPHGSLLVMDLATNQQWFHGIKQDGTTAEPRISLTFRHIGTAWDPATGAVWGVGAPTADRDEAERRVQARAARDAGTAAAEDRAEAERMIQLFRDENIDPAFDAATAYRPGFELRDLRILNAPDAAPGEP